MLFNQWIRNPTGDGRGCAARVIRDFIPRKYESTGVDWECVYIYAWVYIITLQRVCLRGFAAAITSFSPILVSLLYAGVYTNSCMCAYSERLKCGWGDFYFVARRYCCDAIFLFFSLVHFRIITILRTGWIFYWKFLSDIAMVLNEFCVIPQAKVIILRKLF